MPRMRTTLLAPLFWLGTTAALAAFAFGIAASGPPPTRADSVIDILHGVRIVDPYRWLEDQTSPETRAWIDAQNAYTASILGQLPGREKIESELAALMRIDNVGIPKERGGRYFFEKRPADMELYMICMRDGLSGPEQVLIDPHPLSADHTTSVDLFAVSDDGKLLAYGVRNGGEDETTIRLFDVDARADLADVLPRASYNEVEFTPDRAGLYYSKHSDDGPSVLYHALGTDPATDSEIFGEGYGPEMDISISLSEGGRWLLYTVYYGSASKSDVYLSDLAQAGPPGLPVRPAVRPIVTGIDADFEGEIGGDVLYLETDWNAPNGKMIAIPLEDPRQESWRDVLPETGDVLSHAKLAGGRIFATYDHNVIPAIKVYDADGRQTATIESPAMGSSGWLSGRWGSGEVFYNFSSFHYPPTIFRYDIATGAQDVWWKSQVRFDSDNFAVKQVWYSSKDGTRVPMFLAYGKNIKLDGSAPALLEGYGGFRVIETPHFSSSVALWIEHGGVYALPSIRGGSEFGEAWHRAGMLDKKQNTFDDFLAAAEWLIANGYTSPAKLAISGGSNGGLLVGAAMTQRPDLFQAVVCWHPLLDMIRYHRFLVASFWVPEYGSADDEEQFKYIYAYSPYQRVADGVDYPALLMISGDADTRVDPLHARKMVARLQAATSSSRPILLLYDTKGGHMGGKPLTKAISDQVDQTQFLFWQLGIKP